MPKLVENRLTALKVSRAVANGFYIDGRGLYLRIEDGRRLWVFRYTMTGAKPRWFSIGSARDISLADAREAARELRLKVKAGIDPVDERKASKAAAKAANEYSFAHVAGLYIEAHRAGWRNAKHAGQWKATLAAYAYPIIGNKLVAAITVDDVLAVLRPIWTTKPETASRLRGRVESVIDYARAQGWRSGDNPAARKGNLDHLLPARSKVSSITHHPAIPYVNLPNVMTRSLSSEAVSAACLAFTILTAARSGEARGARWNEIDIATHTWTIPAIRMKTKRDHRVPLSNTALAILKAMQPLQRASDGLVFPGGKIDKPLSDVSLNKALAAAAGRGWTVHGLRSSFRDWVSEETGYASEIAEASLSHTIRNKVEAAYARSDLLERRAPLM